MNVNFATPVTCTQYASVQLRVLVTSCEDSGRSDRGPRGRKVREPCWAGALLGRSAEKLLEPRSTRAADLETRAVREEYHVLATRILP